MAMVESVQQVRRERPKWGSMVTHFVLIVFGILMIYPILWMFFGSFKQTNQIFTNPSLLPTHWTVSNYSFGWTALPGVTFGRFILNSFIISGSVVIGTVISCSLVAFAFGRLEFPLKKPLFAVMLMTMMLPTQVTLIPQYTMFHALHWINTYWPLILPSFFGAPFFIFLLVQFIRGIPKELDEAAKIDGCNTWQIFLRIVFPLTVPALTTAGIFSFIWSWDDFFPQLVYLNGTNLFTAPLGLKLFMDESGTQEWGPMFAMSLLSLIPLFLIFLFFQKYIVQGIATSGLKG